jgi:hypothetical protein
MWGVEATGRTEQRTRWLVGGCVGLGVRWDGVAREAGWGWSE